MNLRPSHIEALALDLFGEPNPAARSAHEIRFGRKGSLCVDLEKASFFDHEAGVGGGVIAMVLHAGAAQTRADAWQYIQEICLLAQPAPRAASSRPPKKQVERIEKARRLFAQGRPIANTLAETYLRGRAIDPALGAALRFHPELWNSELQRRLPALLAPVGPLAAPAMITAVQRTWLTPSGGKAGVKMPKKTLGCMRQGAVSLQAFEKEILIGEGVETTLSAATLFGLPAIATLGVANMEKLAVPQSVRRVVIAFDNDPSGAGRRGAETLAVRLWGAGIHVELAGPPAGFKDFNDAAMAIAKEKKNG